jgi:hypothetical protein
MAVLEPRNIYVKLPGDVSDALIRVAGREWRHPKEQAGLLIADGLRRLGELSSDPKHEPVGGPDQEPAA